MKVTLNDLGEDIICSNIAVHLSPDDIFSLSLTSHSFYDYLTTNDIFHLLYLKKFGSKPTPLNLSNYNWKELFKIRTSDQVKPYTWGSSQLGRLGYLLSEIPPDNISNSGILKNVHTPTNLKPFNEFIISDISAGGFSYQILTNGGDLYYTGVNWKKGETSTLTPGPFETYDYKPSAISIPRVESLGSRRSLGGIFMPGIIGRYDRDVERSETTASSNRQTNENLTRPPEQLDLNLPGSHEGRPRKEVKETNFVTKLTLPTNPKYPNRFVTSISSGREHIIAIDNYENIISWDTGNVNNVGVHINFEGLRYNSINKISAGWNLLACYINHIGIVVWYSRTPVTKESFENKTMISNANYLVIPNTGNCKIDDFHAGCDFILYIKDGILQRFNLNTYGFASGSVDSSLLEDPFPVLGFNSWLDNHNSDGETTAYFTKLTGCYNSFSAFTNDGMVLLGNKSTSEEDSEEPPIILPLLQKNRIIHVVMGDYHCLALNDEGDLFSWGNESNKCGCLGLGAKEDFVKNSDNSLVTDLGPGKGMVVNRPTLVKPPTKDGKWLAITASGWNSGGIYILK